MSFDSFDLSAVQSVDPRTVGIVAGIALLISGRRLFWVFVGLVGFLFGYNFALHFLGIPGQTGVVLIALVIGSMGALTAVFFKKIALGLAGFLVGGLGVLWLAAEAGRDTGPMIWLVALVVGLGGSLLARFLFEAALVILSSILGAALLVDGLAWRGIDPVLLFVILVCAGTLFQYLTSGKDRKG